MYFTNLIIAAFVGATSVAAQALTWQYNLHSASNCGGSSFATSGFGVKVEPCIALVPPNNTPFNPVSLSFIEGAGESCSVGLFSSSTCSGTALDTITGNFTCLTPNGSSFSGISIHCS